MAKHVFDVEKATPAELQNVAAFLRSAPMSDADKVLYEAIRAEQSRRRDLISAEKGKKLLGR